DHNRRRNAHGRLPGTSVDACIDSSRFTRIYTIIKEDLTMSSDPRPKLEDCNCLAVRQAARHVTQFYDQYLAQAGLRTTQFSILSRLRRKGPMTINALATETVMDRTTHGRNIQPLERDGLIRIVPGAADRRSEEIHVTSAGDKRLQSAIKEWAHAQTRFESAVGSGRASELRALLRAVTATKFGAN